MNRPQGTLASPVTFEGVGVHTGSRARVEVEPAPPGSGRRFVVGGAEIPALATAVVRCERSTTLGAEGAEVSTVEHLLAAAAGLGLDNLTLRVEGREIPILDGSASEFCRLFLEAGRVEQDLPAPRRVLRRPVFVAQGTGVALALPAEAPELEYHLDYAHPQLGYQRITFRPGEDRFEVELAPARTFALWEEVEPLLERGLARGGDLSNALVVYQDRLSSPLRLENEPVRHKCLDLLGDLALLGADLVARVVVVRGGHKLHVALATSLLQEDLYAERTTDQGAATPPLSVSAPRRGD